ncbi:hypothetical protein D9M68_533200 [compost metagenome]
MSTYTLANGREIISEVLMKLDDKALADLPMACKACPEAMWMLAGKADNVTPKCFCRQMHAFTWPPMKGQGEEILDCDMLYQPDEGEDSPPPPQASAPAGNELQDLQPQTPELDEDAPLSGLDPLAGLEAIPE